jgi:hypothetical protein
MSRSKYNLSAACKKRIIDRIESVGMAERMYKARETLVQLLLDENVYDAAGEATILVCSWTRKDDTPSWLRTFCANYLNDTEFERKELHEAGTAFMDGLRALEELKL